MANPRKPTELKRLAGNPGKGKLNDAEPEFLPAETIAPDWLQGEGLHQWNKLAPQMALNNLLNVATVEPLATYCDLLGAYIDSRRSGEVPDMRIFNSLRLMAKEFGFTPSSKGGIVAPEKGKKNDKSRFFS
ncbi:hypothetical protein [Acinetobacter radioresistens]|uniref:hypothetical protein n=1 Tax=Acinetobacter radioresistens TaxID=40216 RepID=UPI00094631C4|nr:hypothetical protein [Acinetobacter radioresistens]